MESTTTYKKKDTQKWMTPPEVYNPLNEEFEFNFDPCPIVWKEGDADGLSIEWGTRTFCNPPYKNAILWIEKAYNEWKKGKVVVMLINAITDTKAFHKFILNNAEIRFVKGRIKFIDPDRPEVRKPSTLPSLIIVFK